MIKSKKHSTSAQNVVLHTLSSPMSTSANHRCGSTIDSPFSCSFLVTDSSSHAAIFSHNDSACSCYSDSVNMSPKSFFASSL
mmetsp:Transcript_17696/g.24377  ORF Transcript_17696/g.24377 Transcript_17696/m.24377 type:complete len:82 (-) Transcript_17696:520-765(-)